MRVQTEATLRQEKLALASNHYHHVYDFADEVSQDSVETCLAQLAIWDRLEPGQRDEAGNLIEPGCDMTIVMDSNGGSVIDGMHLFDDIVAYSLRGGGNHKVTMRVRGWAASMAGILLQSADVRVVGPESWVMIHEVSAWQGGSLGKLKDHMDWLNAMSDRIADIFVKRSGGKTSREQFDVLWSRKEKYLDSAEVMAHGFADKIG